MRWMLPFGALLLAAVAACDGPAPQAKVLRLLDFHQANAEGVFLNETLVFHFSDDLDRSSVTRHSLRIVDSRGSRVPGTIEVAGSRVRFHPRFPTSPDLSDGGLLPGATYHVEVVGFPFPDGFRGRDEAPLATTHRFRFLTVARALTDDHRVFSALLSEEVPILRIAATHLGPVDPIRIEVDQPLDPRTVVPEAFELLDGAEPLDLRVRMTENTRDRAVIELWVRGEGENNLRALEPGSWYVLRLAEDVEPPRTLGGLPVQPAWIGSRLPGARITVFGSRLSSKRVEFDLPPPSAETRATSRRDQEMHYSSNWSVEPVRGADGMASWGEGRVTIRYPAAAGTGADGHIELSELTDPARLRDVHAERMTLAPSSEIQLPFEGLVVLRSQGSIELAGAFVRPRAITLPPPMEFPPGETLSEWLERAKEMDHAWTVLIAGGDLIVPVGAGLHLEGPLLLVAGGRLRIGDSMRASELWKLAPGDGGRFVIPELLWVPTANDLTLPPEKRFVVDEPTTNPLVSPIRFGVMSASFRPRSGVAAWRPGHYEGEAGAGSLSVLWLGQRSMHGGVEEFGPVEDVLLLQGSDAMRFQIELTMPARSAEGGDWDPPTVDYVEFNWDAPGPGAPDDNR